MYSFIATISNLKLFAGVPEEPQVAFTVTIRPHPPNGFSPAKIIKSFTQPTNELPA